MATKSGGQLHTAQSKTMGQKVSGTFQNTSRELMSEFNNAALGGSVPYKRMRLDNTLK